VTSFDGVLEFLFHDPHDMRLTLILNGLDFGMSLEIILKLKESKQGIMLAQASHPSTSPN